MMLELRRLSYIPVSLQDTVTLVTNITVVISIAVLAYQVYLQRKETEYNRYEKLMSDFSATAALLIEHPEVRDTYLAGSGRPKKWESYTEAQKKTFCYFDSLISLLERVYVGVPHSKTTDDWDGWKLWIQDLATNDLFIDSFNNCKRMYGKEFVDEVDRVIEKVRVKK